MRITALYFSDPLYQSADFLSAPFAGALVQGQNQAAQRLGAEGVQNFNGGLISAGWNDPDRTALNVTVNPTVVFIDADTGTSLARLQGAQITADAVETLYYQLATSGRDETGTGGPGGGGTGNGDGFFSLPWWLLLGVGYYFYERNKKA